MREWLVIENSWKNSAFAPDEAKRPTVFISGRISDAYNGG